MRKKITLALVSITLGLGLLTGTAAAGPSGNQRFTLLFENTQEEARIMASGPIRGAGRIFLVGSTDLPDGTFVETYRAELPSGGFLLTAAGADESFAFDPRSCVLRLTIGGTLTVSDGTGAYRGLTGQGSFTTRVVEVSPRTAQGECSEDSRGVGVTSASAQVGPSAAS